MGKRRRYKLLLKRIKSAFPVKFFTRFFWAVSVELCWPTVWVVSLIFVKFRSSKRGIAPRKKIESKCPVDMHIYTLCPSLLQSFRKSYWAISEELRWPTVSVAAFIFVKFLSWKKDVTPRKKIEWKFPVVMHMYT